MNRFIMKEKRLPPLQMASIRTLYVDEKMLARVKNSMAKTQLRGLEMLLFHREGRLKMKLLEPRVKSGERQGGRREGCDRWGRDLWSSLDDAGYH